ncbi:hypothetical protein COCON_G00136120 [Conger conger]|uniref:MalT-like TPR region domain-containing protein n=1 Tax=Conger conger TaxID=82655 RepID=A0A9Q1DFL2_CONCO|nr:tetratricopeptide repeat protein 19, mitochondrial isoform X1 [Conger conger]KAJ8268440.1 hypothetical protein COCON_G00136120 [Conger conger]
MAFCSVFRLLLKHRARFQTVVLDWTRTQCLWSLAHVQMRALKWENAVTSRSVEEEQHARHGRSCKLRSAVCSGEGSGDSRTDSINKHFILYSFFAFSFFGKSDEEDEAKKTEDEIIMLLKRAKLSIMQDELEAASGYLHQAIRLAHQSHNNQAIIYTYSLMANLAFVQGQLTNAEKLFKAAMSFLLSGGTSQDDNAVIEMSLKLATIYATQKRHELADHGFRFCIESLEAKIENQKDLPEDALPDEERKDTRLLLGLTLDSRARYRTAMHRLEQAQGDYRRALQICREEQGEAHPQTLVLMNDLATVLDMQGQHQEALGQVKRAVELGKEAGHPDQHVLLGNMAGILLHQGQLEESGRMYQEALAMAQATGDSEAVEQIQEGLKELETKKKKNGQEDSA